MREITVERHGWKWFTEGNDSFKTTCPECNNRVEFIHVTHEGLGRFFCPACGCRFTVRRPESGHPPTDKEQAQPEA